MRLLTLASLLQEVSRSLDIELEGKKLLHHPESPKAEQERGI